MECAHYFASLNGRAVNDGIDSSWDERGTAGFACVPTERHGFHHFAKTTLVMEIRQGSHDKLGGLTDGPTPDSFVIFGKGEPG